MDYFLSQEQQMIRDLARKVAREKILPVRAELDEKEEFPWEIVKISADAGLMGVSMPEEYEGFGGGVLEYCLVAEELSRVCLGIATSVVASGLGAMPILVSGSPEQKKRYLPDIAKGEACRLWLTEADAGSDAGSIRTTATRTSEGYLLNGTKQWITNGGEAEIYTIIAMTDRSKGPRGASAFIVEKGAQGFHLRQEGEEDGDPRLGYTGAGLSGLLCSERESDWEGRHGVYRHHEDLRSDEARGGGPGGWSGTGGPG